MKIEGGVAQNCAHCGGAVALQMAEWKPNRGAPTPSQSWVCPYCFSKNEGEFAGRLAWVTKRPANE